MLEVAEDPLRPKVGELVKVCLPTNPENCAGCASENPWAICRQVYEDGTFDAEINNELIFTEDHSLKCGDVVRFELGDGFWVPVMEEKAVH